MYSIQLHSRNDKAVLRVRPENSIVNLHTARTGSVMQSMVHAGFSLSDIASDEGCCVATVKRHLALGIARSIPELEAVLARNINESTGVIIARLREKARFSYVKGTAKLKAAA